jgi:hypothetical protein
MAIPEDLTINLTFGGARAEDPVRDSGKDGMPVSSQHGGLRGISPAQPVMPFQDCVAPYWPAGRGLPGKRVAPTGQPKNGALPGGDLFRINCLCRQ